MVLYFLLRYTDSDCPYGIFKLFSGHVFQHGIPRCYVARVCQYFLNQNHTRFLPWPTLSPDQSTIAHVYNELSRRVHHPQNPRETLQALRDAVYEWNNITKSLSNDCLVVCVGDAKLLLLQEVFTHVTELRKHPYCMTISVFP